MNLQKNIVVTVLSNGSVLTYWTYDLTKAYSYTAVSNVRTLQTLQTSGVSKISFVEEGWKATFRDVWEIQKIPQVGGGIEGPLPQKRFVSRWFLNLLRVYKLDLLYSQHQREHLIFFGLNRLFTVFPGLVIWLYLHNNLSYLYI